MGMGAYCTKCRGIKKVGSLKGRRRLDDCPVCGGTGLPSQEQTLQLGSASVMLVSGESSARIQRARHHRKHLMNEPL